MKQVVVNLTVTKSFIFDVVDVVHEGDLSVEDVVGLDTLEIMFADDSALREDSYGEVKYDYTVEIVDV